ncbi:MAG: bifunctional phosphopantothenoylcysteine decarboxylase/phosphopantothenate--cysteine ligase CoaBC [Pseudomonadota bacterium]|jgi:phosphopantothenoylcysteine decarboxylase/phosphopantothenate--cysteine ligase
MKTIQELAGKHFILGITGGVAAYKAADLCRRLQDIGATVQVVMTPAACQFITPLTLQALSGRRVMVYAWDKNDPIITNAMPHIESSRCADAIIIAPATADFMAKLVHGFGNDVLSNMCLARNCQTVPLLVAPAMNVEMWNNPATIRNIAQLQTDGVAILGPAQGLQACGETGTGRLLEVADIVREVIAHFQPKLLQGKRVLITAGATFEAIDPVRGITNISSGKMGYAVAQAAWEAGAQVLLVSGISSLPTPYGVKRIHAQTAYDMQVAVETHSVHQDIFFSVAAVADWRAATVSEQKIKKVADKTTYTVEMVQNPDILMAIAASKRAQSGELYCVGFSAETEHFDTHAQAKRLKKGVPLLVSNDARQAMKSDDNALSLYDVHGVTHLPLQTKLSAARALIAAVAQRLSQ